MGEWEGEWEGGRSGRAAVPSSPLKRVANSQGGDTVLLPANFIALRGVGWEGRGRGGRREGRGEEEERHHHT